MADACECICSYQWAMRRLMQILNQAQTYCTEDDCQDPQGQDGNGAQNTTTMMMMFFMMFAFVMFMLRPADRNRQGDGKPGPSNNNNNNQPPPPDVST